MLGGHLLGTSSPRYALIAMLAACRPAIPVTPPIPPVSTGKLRVRVFTEPSPVRQLASAGRFVFVATESELERWDEHNRVHTLPHVVGTPIALAPDLDNHRIWIATEHGVGRYDITSERFEPLPLPDPPLAGELATIAASEDGAWVGTSRGLFHVGAAGWTATAIKDPVIAMVRDRSGALWIANKTKLVRRKPTHDLVTLTEGHGFAIAEPRLMVELPDDQLLVIGSDSGGHERVAIGRELTWTTYRALPEVRFQAAARRGAGAVAMANGRLYRIAVADPRHVTPLARDGMRLVAVASAPTTGADRPQWQIDPIAVVVPPGALTLASLDDQLLIGTRDLGTARYRDGDPRPHEWLRRRQMFLDATSLSVACARANDCWVATGTHQAWHWDGNGFTPRGPDDIVEAVVRDGRGTLFALHHATVDDPIQLSRIEPLTRAWLATTIRLPAGHLAVARMAATSSLWVGFDDRDELAIVDLDDARPAGVTGVPRVEIKPSGAGGIARALELAAPDHAWVASRELVAHHAGKRSAFWTAVDARALARMPDGTVMLATGNGALRFDGVTWDAPPALGFAINSIAATSNGQLWMATDHGIAAWDGHNVRRIDTRRGLTENAILDVAVDQFDRVWARGAGSLALITP